MRAIFVNKFIPDYDKFLLGLKSDIKVLDLFQLK
jgi:hypothetical protein